MLLENRVALVTGAGSGIGRAVALAYAREGCHVLLLGRRVGFLEESYDRILEEGGRASIVPLDLETDLGRVPELVATIHRRHGRLDILVNNAAQLGDMVPLESFRPPIWEMVLRVNLTAPYFLTRELLPLLRQSPSASVINVISGVAMHGRAYWGAYAASKAALLNLTQTWSAELCESSVRINAVNPGGTATAMRARAFPGEDPAELPTPESIVPVFLYLASDHSRLRRGENLEAREWCHWRP
ncbi:MAG: SDR family NAD(P)-dependent oxidoreductase [Magnetococcales bacterium]|nr:SDR family NAD(P)-dependent oxidoreductase [Magnetococcales bacterium]